eukprot:TRINITY_DN12411_c0_g2_i6.p1 TRINITY_DN12411_c0_g2~~TRINITY_DN12411_c0_g2_i6.p1  ORF type:complete len:233 (+),score=47.36 TRINITY_DN12411_c0_g2_i6:212-910(+)
MVLPMGKQASIRCGVPVLFLLRKPELVPICRDWTYRGNRIVNNLFYNINSVFNRSKGSPNSVHAVYLDDSGSGFYIANNTFRNVTNAFMLGGGRDNHFVNNTIDGCGQGGVMPGNKHLGTPIYFDNRDMGWASKNCNQSDLKDATLIQFLYRVPYNETPYTKYEHLANILEDHPCVPKYNNISYNAYCHLLHNNNLFYPTNSSMAAWNSTHIGNHPLNASCAWVNTSLPAST